MQVYNLPEICQAHNQSDGIFFGHIFVKKPSLKIPLKNQANKPELQVKKAQTKETWLKQIEL